jgi:hypothetical protein
MSMSPDGKMTIRDLAARVKNLFSITFARCCTKEVICDYDPKAIANMEFTPFSEEGLPPVEMVRVRVQHRIEDDETMWSEAV